jgi:hypothetical protein
MTKNFKQFSVEKNKKNLNKNSNSYAKAFTKDVQATGEAFILLIFWGMFALMDPDMHPNADLDPDPAEQNQHGFLRIRIHNTSLN